MKKKPILIVEIDFYSCYNKNVAGVIFFECSGTQYVYGGHFETNYI